MSTTQKELGLLPRLRKLYLSEPYPTQLHILGCVMEYVEATDYQGVVQALGGLEKLKKLLTDVSVAGCCGLYSCWCIAVDRLLAPCRDVKHGSSAVIAGAHTPGYRLNEQTQVMHCVHSRLFHVLHALLVQPNLAGSAGRTSDRAVVTMPWCLQAKRYFVSSVRGQVDIRIRSMIPAVYPHTAAGSPEVGSAGAQVQPASGSPEGSSAGAQQQTAVGSAGSSSKHGDSPPRQATTAPGVSMIAGVGAACGTPAAVGSSSAAELDDEPDGEPQYGHKEFGHAFCADMLQGESSFMCPQADQS
jgi:hypothetical protein